MELNKNINIFKLNGDIDNLKHAVITKKDLEEYFEKHRLLLSFFKRELVVKSFLIIGYSFTDSLILSCISELSQAFDGEHPYHYTIMKKSNEPDFINFVSDLEIRYHIKTLLIEDYDEIKEILRDINYYTNQYNVFISGSYRGNDEKKLLEISKFCNKLTYSLYKENLRIINGYGYKVGYYIAAAATKIMLEENVSSFEKYLLMHPFDEHLTSTQQYRHREFMLSKANVVIFMYGFASDDSGMLEEFQIAKKDPRKIIIPLGCTGGAAKLIYDEVKANIIQYPYLEKIIDNLLKEQNYEDLISLILDIIQQNLE
ncbi:MAG: SIR2 family protein [Lachnospiraceae bacterium]|nr:SIR2 family protein [Lachnospiraceae bacterium]